MCEGTYVPLSEPIYAKKKRLFEENAETFNPIQTGGGGGGRKVPALTLNVYNFFKIQPNAAKLYEFF